MWTFLRVFPMIFGEELRNDIRFMHYIKLVKLLRLTLQDIFDEQHIIELENCVFDYLSEFRILYPDKNLTAKHHFLVHYGRNIRLFGPLKQLWCMRYESKHSYFKQVGNSIHNYINITYSLANRHQYSQVHYLMQQNYFHVPEYGPVDNLENEEVLK